MINWTVLLCVILRERQRVKDLPAALELLADSSPRVTRLRMTVSPGCITLSLREAVELGSGTNQQFTLRHGRCGETKLFQIVLMQHLPDVRLEWIRRAET